LAEIVSTPIKAVTCQQRQDGSPWADHLAANRSALNSAITAYDENGTGEEGNPALGDALSREVRQSYYDKNSKADRYGTI